jgi:hypothetical protein
MDEPSRVGESWARGTMHPFDFPAARSGIPDNVDSSAGRESSAMMPGAPSQNRGSSQGVWKYRQMEAIGRGSRVRRIVSILIRLRAPLTSEVRCFRSRRKRPRYDRSALMCLLNLDDGSAVRGGWRGGDKASDSQIERGRRGEEIPPLGVERNLVYWWRSSLPSGCRTFAVLYSSALIICRLRICKRMAAAVSVATTSRDGERVRVNEGGVKLSRFPSVPGNGDA